MNLPIPARICKEWNSRPGPNLFVSYRKKEAQKKVNAKARGPRGFPPEMWIFPKFLLARAAIPSAATSRKAKADEYKYWDNNFKDNQSYPWRLEGGRRQSPR